MRAFISSLFILALILTGVFYVFGEVVPPGYVGIRQIYYGPGEGYANKSLKAGFHWTLPFYSRIHLIPASVQTLNLSKSLGSQLDNVKTSDGALVDVDVTIITQFFQEKDSNHGGPSDLIRKLDLSPQKWSQHIKSTAERYLRSSLSNLSASTFYDPELRSQLVSEAQEGMKSSLAEFGIDIKEVLLLRYTYQSDLIDRAIFDKNLQDQEVRYNEAAGRFSEAKSQLEKTEAEWDAKIETLRIQGQNDSTVIRSEAALYEKEKKASGDLEVAKAIAEVDRLKSSALASTPGAEIYVAREIAPYVSSLKGGIITNVDPYNLDDWIKRLGIK